MLRQEGCHHMKRDLQVEVEKLKREAEDDMEEAGEGG